MELIGVGQPLDAVESHGSFSMEHLQPHELTTDSNFWRNFREGLEPTDLVFEFVNRRAAFGGVVALRGRCAIKHVELWVV